MAMPINAVGVADFYIKIYFLLKYFVKFAIFPVKTLTKRKI